MIGEHAAGAGAGQKADHHAGEDGQRRIGDGADGDQTHADQESGTELPDEVEPEGPKTHGWLAVRGERNRRVARLEPDKDSIEHLVIMV